jgi:RNA polymerase sigma-70 factor, ECF subfamily
MDANGMDDNLAQLIRRAKEGEEEASEELFTIYYTPVYRYLYLRLAHKDDAVDLTQDVFIRAWRALPRYEIRGTPILAWLFTIARTTLYDHTRKKKRRPEVYLEEVSLAQIHALEDAHSRQYTQKSESANEREHSEHESAVRKRLTDALTILTEEQRDVILWHYIDGYAHADIAQFLGKKEGAVRTICSRARTRLHKHAEKYPYNTTENE